MHQKAKPRLDEPGFFNFDGQAIEIMVGDNGFEPLTSSM